jgi:hypothetical protein
MKTLKRRMDRHFTTIMGIQRKYCMAAFICLWLFVFFFTASPVLWDFSLNVTPISDTPHHPRWPSQFPHHIDEIKKAFQNVSQGCRDMMQVEKPHENISKLAFPSALFYRTEIDLLNDNRSSLQFFQLPKFDAFHDLTNLTAKGGIAMFQNAFFMQDRLFVFDCQFVYVPGGCKTEDVTKEAFPFAKFISQVRNNQYHTIDNDVVLIAQFWGYSYYHHMIEDLPRLAMVLNFLVENPSAQFVAYNSFPQHHLLYSMLGLNATRQLLPYDDKLVYYAKKRLLVPTATHCGRVTGPAARDLQARFLQQIPIMLNDKLAQFVEEHKLDEHKLILVQKRDGVRSIRNHNQMVQVLEEQLKSCCRVVVFKGSESMEQTFVMHFLADVIVGPHGAGLSNLIFSKKGVGLVEIHPKQGNQKTGSNLYGINYCHQYTAKAVGARARLIVASDGNADSTFEANVDEIVSVVRSLLNESLN